MSKLGDPMTQTSASNRARLRLPGTRGRLMLAIGVVVAMIGFFTLPYLIGSEWQSPARVSVRSHWSQDVQGVLASAGCQLYGSSAVYGPFGFSTANFGLTVFFPSPIDGGSRDELVISYDPIQDEIAPAGMNVALKILIDAGCIDTSEQQRIKSLTANDTALPSKNGTSSISHLTPNDTEGLTVYCSLLSATKPRTG